MIRKSPIQFFFGWLLLLLFSFSITPRQVLHDVFADHTDLSVKASAGESAGVSKTGFNCDRLNLVAESPFIETDEFVENTPAQTCTDFIVVSVHAAAPKVIVLPGLRGPPCI